MKFGHPIGKFCLMLLVICVGLAVQGCGSAKRGHVKAKIPVVTAVFNWID